MLVVVFIAMQVYAMRKTGDLLRSGPTITSTARWRASIRIRRIKKR